MCSVDSYELKLFIRELILKDYISLNFSNVIYDEIKDKDDEYIKRFFQIESILNY